MNIPLNSVAKPLAPQAGIVAAPLQEPKSPSSPPAQDSVSFRDIVAIGAGGVAGVAGATYGLGEGLIKGGIEAYPKHISTGATIGAKVVTPLGKALGGAGAIVAVGVATVAAPVLTIAAAAGGVLDGTVNGAITAGKTELPKAIDAGEKWGASAFATALKVVGQAIGGSAAALVVLPSILYPPVGKTLIPAAFNKGAEYGGKAGEATGDFIGGSLGALGGLAVGSAVSVYKGLPEGYQTGKDAGKDTSKLITELPSFAQHAWTAGVSGGGDVGANVGELLGGSAGFVTATGATVVAGVDNSIHRAADWAGSTAAFVRGDKAKPSAETGLS